MGENHERTPLLESSPPYSDDCPNQAPSIAEEEHTAANQTLSQTRAIFCALAIGCLVLLMASNISMLTTTQSAIAEELNCPEQTTWFSSAYLIAMAALGPLNGKLSAVFSPRLCICAASLIMAVGVTCSALAARFETFLVGRTLTGIGASGVFIVSTIIVLELTGSKRRGLGIGLLNSGYTTGVSFGAVAAGALLPKTGWRFLFWIQAPLAVMAGLVLIVAIPADFTSGPTKIAVPSDSLHDPKIADSVWKKLARLDYIGAVTLTSAIVLALYSLSSPKNIPYLPFILSGLVLATFIVNEVYWAQDPIIPVSLLRSRGLLLTCLSTTGIMMGRWSVLFHAPTYAIAVKQWSPVVAGSILIPTNAGFAVGGLLVGGLHIRRSGSFYLPTLICFALFPFTLVMIASSVGHDTSPQTMILAVTLCGLCTGAALNYGLAHVLHLTPKDTHYVATALLATFRGFAGSFGSAIGGGLFTRTLANSLRQNFASRGVEDREELIVKLLGMPALVSRLTGLDRVVAVLGYEEALRVLFLAGAALAALMVLVQAGTGWEKEEHSKQGQVEVAAEH